VDAARCYYRLCYIRRPVVRETAVPVSLAYADAVPKHPDPVTHAIVRHARCVHRRQVPAGPRNGRPYDAAAWDARAHFKERLAAQWNEEVPVDPAVPLVPETYIRPEARAVIRLLVVNPAPQVVTLPVRLPPRNSVLAHTRSPDAGNEMQVRAEPFVLEDAKAGNDGVLYASDFLPLVLLRLLHVEAVGAGLELPALRHRPERDCRVIRPVAEIPGRMFVSLQDECFRCRRSDHPQAHSADVAIVDDTPVGDFLVAKLYRRVRLDLTGRDAPGVHHVREFLVQHPAAIIRPDLVPPAPGGYLRSRDGAGHLVHADDYSRMAFDVQ